MVGMGLPDSGVSSSVDQIDHGVDGHCELFLRIPERSSCH